MVFGTILKEGAHRLALLFWVVSVTVIAIVPLLILSVVLVVADTILYVSTAIIPGVEVTNFRFIFGKDSSPGTYLYGWYSWIAGNMNVIFSSVPASGKWAPPIVP